jgi:AcrR family transcriptional regulator
MGTRPDITPLTEPEGRGAARGEERQERRGTSDELGRRSEEGMGRRAEASRREHSPRRGRPPRIDREAIAQAAGEIPLSNLSLRSVADRLGVSVPGLYHYVQGRDELFALAAERSVRRWPLPVDHDQHWAVWLYEWAVYIRDANVSEPGLIKQYLDAAIGVEVMADSIDAALALCVRQGFSAIEAFRAYHLVSECALGAAVAQIREDRARKEGRPSDWELHRILAREDRPLPHLGMIASEAVFEPSARFHDHVTTVLVGIAAQRGESPCEVVTLLAGTSSQEDDSQRRPHRRAAAAPPTRWHSSSRRE